MLGAHAQPAPDPRSIASAEPPIETLKSLQVDFAEAGHYRGAIDGLFGPMSRAALNELLAAARQARL